MQSQTLVPPGRFGALLIQQRKALGCSVGDLATQSDRFEASDLDRLERGAADLSDHDVEAVMQLYGLDLSSGAYARSELVVDLSTGRVASGGACLEFENSDGDVILERYVSLLYLLREQPVGSALPLRANDIDTLSDALQRPADRVVADIEGIVCSQRIVGRTQRLSRRRRVLQAGLLVGASLAGSLIIVGDFVPEAAASVAEKPSQRGELVLDATGFDLATVLPGWSVQFSGDHPIYGGMTHARQQVIKVHVDPRWSDDRLADILMHEIGHAIDLEYLDDRDREAWTSMRSIDTGWWTGNGQRDFDVGAGDFAEAVSSAWLGSDNDSRYGAFTSDQLAFVRQILDDVTQPPRVRST